MIANKMGGAIIEITKSSRILLVLILSLLLISSLSSVALAALTLTKTVDSDDGDPAHQRHCSSIYICSGIIRTAQSQM